MEEFDRDTFRVRKKNDTPPTGIQRAAGYLVPIVLFALMGGAIAGYWYGSGGGLRNSARHAATVTSKGVKTIAIAGALLGAVFGAVVAWKSEKRPGR